MVGALEQVGGDVGEESFDLVDPGGVRRGEVHAESGMRVQQFRDRGGLVGSVVVADQVDVEVVGDFFIDLGQELLNSIDRCLRWMLEMTVPSAVLNAANRLVVPCRT